MISPTYLAGILLVSTLRSVLALPQPNVDEFLFKRTQVTYESCGGPDDAKQKKAAQAYADAITLAGAASGSTAFPDTDAFVSCLRFRPNTYSDMCTVSSTTSSRAIQLPSTKCIKPLLPDQDSRSPAIPQVAVSLSQSPTLPRQQIPSPRKFGSVPTSLPARVP